MKNTFHLLQELEERLTKPSVRKDTEEVSSLLSDKFLEFGSSGRVFTRSQILQELAEESPREITCSDFQIEMLAPEVALVTYRTVRNEAGLPPRHTLRSSIWQKEGDRWRVRFHQGTLMPQQ
jgi:hypothetical protein